MSKTVYFSMVQISTRPGFQISDLSKDKMLFFLVFVVHYGCSIGFNNFSVGDSVPVKNFNTQVKQDDFTGMEFNQFDTSVPITLGN